ELAKFVNQVKPVAVPGANDQGDVALVPVGERIANDAIKRCQPRADAGQKKWLEWFGAGIEAFAERTLHFYPVADARCVISPAAEQAVVVALDVKSQKPVFPLNAGEGV